MRTALVVLLCGMMMGGCSWINSKLGIDDDSLMEEFLEQQLLIETGISLDLTPKSPEA